MTIRRRNACWISKATGAQVHAHARKPPPPPHTHTHRICAFPRQRKFRESTLMLRYVHCLLCLKVGVSKICTVVYVICVFV
jgi:hypothetical protein